MLGEPRPTLTIVGAKTFNVGRWVAPTRQMGITPHVAQTTPAGAIDGRTTRHPGYALSQRNGKRSSSSSAG